MKWHDLLFAHWPMEAGALRAHVPPGLKVDTFAGSAWIGVVPFRMSGIRLRYLPPLPTTRAFPELNVRTYVRGGGRPGVWFFSLDAASRLAVLAARAWFGLPYHHARMRCAGEREGVRYRCRRGRGGGSPEPARFEAFYRPAGPVGRARPGSLEHFLVERYRLFSRDRSGELLRAEIRHEPWPLQPAEARIEENTMAEASGLRLPGADPLLHFARELDVRSWSPEPL